MTFRRLPAISVLDEKYEDKRFYVMLFVLILNEWQILRLKDVHEIPKFFQIPTKTWIMWGLVGREECEWGKYSLNFIGICILSGIPVNLGISAFEYFSDSIHNVNDKSVKMFLVIIQHLTTYTWNSFTERVGELWHGMVGTSQTRRNSSIPFVPFATLSYAYIVGD